MNVIVLAIKPMQPEEPRFPVRVEFNWGANDEIFGNSAITVEVWLDKAQLRRLRSRRSTMPPSRRHTSSWSGPWTPRPPRNVITGF